MPRFGWKKFLMSLGSWGKCMDIQIPRTAGHALGRYCCYSIVPIDLLTYSWFGSSDLSLKELQLVISSLKSQCDPMT